MPRKKQAPTQQRWLDLFLEFISHLKILSKELDHDEEVTLIDVLYESQWRYLQEVCEGLDRGIRFFVCLKARQLGISTISLAIDLFWLHMFPGIQGALITDDESNRDKFRAIIDYYLKSLPKSLRVGARKHNRNILVLKNGSMLDYLVAGKRSNNRTLGQSRAFNFVHGTEVGSWGSEEGYNSLISSLAQKHPHRLYMFESTAHGFNLFNNIWQQAQDDDLRKKAFFIGWFHNNAYRFERDTPEFNRYWTGELDPGEKIYCDEVKFRYGYTVQPEQIAWHRHKRTNEITSDDLMAQNFPWHEDEAFIMTGAAFFPMMRLSEDVKFLTANKPLFKGYRYHMGDNFLATVVEQVTRSSDADLRIFEEPDPQGVYVIGADPAFGRSDVNDQHALLVLRCYADCAVQVAEFATAQPDTYQFAWVLAHLAGSYRNVWVNLEINGPGPVVMQELKHIKQLINNGYLRADAMSKGMEQVFDAVRWYLYHRVDSVSGNYMYNWKTSQDNKLAIMNQLRDNYTLRSLRIRSLRMLEQMRTIIQDGGAIEADGKNKDDLVFALALANRAWIDWVRPSLIGLGDTYEVVTHRQQQARDKPQTTMVAHVVEDFFASKEKAREEAKYNKAWEGGIWR